MAKRIQMGPRFLDDKSQKSPWALAETDFRVDACYMIPRRRSTEVVGEILRAMAETVVSYHPTVGGTGITIEALICGTACFPGGTGLWRGNGNGGVLPEYFPEKSVMFVGHNFDSDRGYATSLERGGEVDGDFWIRLLRILDVARLEPNACFSNALMGIKPGKAEGEMPSVPGYKKQCRRFLQRQVEIVRPCALVALGAQAIGYVCRVEVPHIKILHPGDWCLRPLATRENLLAAEGRKLRSFIDSLDEWPLAFDATEGHPAYQPLVQQMCDKASGKTIMMKNSAKTDDWGFRIGTRNSFLMQTLEQGGKSKEQIKLEFQNKFPGSAGKSTFRVFFTDVIRPFGSASVSRCIRIESDESGRLYLDPERSRVVKSAVAGGILTEINALEGNFPKKNLQAIDAIVDKYHAPRK
jgi:hypothetical protein